MHRTIAGTRARASASVSQETPPVAAPLRDDIAVDKKDAAKVSFINAAMAAGDECFTEPSRLTPELRDIIGWIGSRGHAEARFAAASRASRPCGRASPCTPRESRRRQVREFRENALARFREIARDLRDGGAVDHWMRHADPAVREVAKEVNGPLLEVLATMAEHPDMDAIEFFREARERARSTPTGPPRARSACRARR